MGEKITGWLRQVDLDSRSGRLRRRPGGCGSVKLFFDKSISNADICDAIRRKGYSEFVGKWVDVSGEFHVFAIFAGSLFDRIAMRVTARRTLESAMSNKCPKCGGHGDNIQQWWADGTTLYRKCESCGGTGVNAQQITDDLIERIEIMSRQYKEDLDKEQGYTTSEQVFQEGLLAACETIADVCEELLEELGAAWWGYNGKPESDEES